MNRRNFIGALLGLPVALSVPGIAKVWPRPYSLPAFINEDCRWAAFKELKAKKELAMWQSFHDLFEDVVFDCPPQQLTYQPQE